MCKNFIFSIFATLLVAQLVTPDELDDVRAALNDLRQAVSDALNEAFVEYVKMATEVDATAYRAMDADEYAVRCANIASNKTIGRIEKMSITLGEMALKPTWEDEVEIVRCGRADTECLTSLTEKIKKQTEEAADVAKKQLEADREEIDEALEDLYLCAV